MFPADNMIFPWQLGPSSLVPFWRSGSDLAYNPCLICPGLNQSDTHPLTPSNIQIPKIVIFAKFDKIIGGKIYKAAGRKSQTSGLLFKIHLKKQSLLGNATLLGSHIPHSVFLWDFSQEI